MIRTIIRASPSIALRLDAVDHRCGLAVRIGCEMEADLYFEATSVLVGHVDINHERLIRRSIPGVVMLIVDCGIMSRIGFSRREPYACNVGAIDVHSIIADDYMRRSGQRHKFTTACVGENHGDADIFELRCLQECVGRSLWLGGCL